MTTLFKTLVLLCLSFSAISQNNLDGTFQLMTTNSKIQELFTTDYLVLIEAERLLDQVAIVKIGDYTWVRILSTNTINDPSFTPLSDEVILIDPESVMIKSTISSELNN